MEKLDINSELPTLIEVKDTANERVQVENIGENRVDINLGDITLRIFNNREYFEIFTIPYGKEVRLTFNNFNDIGNDLFEILKKLIENVVASYYLYQNIYNNRIAVNVEERYIAFLSDSTDPNILKISYDPLITSITLSIFLNPKNGYGNNKVILDKDGALARGYYEVFQEFFARLYSLGLNDSQKRKRRKNIFERIFK